MANGISERVGNAHMRVDDAINVAQLHIWRYAVKPALELINKRKTSAPSLALSLLVAAGAAIGNQIESAKPLEASGPPTSTPSKTIGCPEKVGRTINFVKPQSPLVFFGDQNKKVTCVVAATGLNGTQIQGNSIFSLVRDQNGQIFSQDMLIPADETIQNLPVTIDSKGNPTIEVYNMWMGSNGPHTEIKLVNGQLIAVESPGDKDNVTSTSASQTRVTVNTPATANSNSSKTTATDAAPSANKTAIPTPSQTPGSNTSSTAKTTIITPNSITSTGSINVRTVNNESNGGGGGELPPIEIPDELVKYLALAGAALAGGSVIFIVVMRDGPKWLKDAARRDAFAANRGVVEENFARESSLSSSASEIAEHVNIGINSAPSGVTYWTYHLRKGDRENLDKAAEIVRNFNPNVLKRQIEEIDERLKKMEADKSSDHEFIKCLKLERQEKELELAYVNGDINADDLKRRLSYL